jgi:calcium-dependent protein kinase
MTAKTGASGRPTMPGSKPSSRPTMTRIKTVWVTKATAPFRDDYQVGQQIGEAGQFGKAYRCKRKQDRKILAVKAISKARFYRLDRSASRRQALLIAMQGEIDIMRRLKHQYIVNMSSVYEDKHTLYIVMEECKGGELFDRIRAKQRYKEHEAAPIIKMMLEALFYMHEYHRVVHCDLKPDNILFVNKREDSPIKIIDFGMSKVLPRLRNLRELCGTPYYTAPEIIGGSYAHGCDMWSVGVIMFVMLFGFPPFYVDPNKYYGQKEAQAIYKLINKGFNPTVKRGYGAWFPKKMPVSPDVKILMQHLMETDVSKRFSAKAALQTNWITNMGKSVAQKKPSSSSNANNTNNADVDVSGAGGSSTMSEIDSITAHQMAGFADNNKFKFAISSLFRGQFEKMRPQHFQNLKDLFRGLDKDNNGKIDYQEFKEGMLKSKDLNMTEEQIMKIFKGLDVNALGEIDFDAMLNAAVHDYIVANDQRLYKAFHLDDNDSGTIQASQLKAKLQKLNPYGSALDIEQIVKKMDTNDDGSIDYEEFLRALHPDFNQTPTWFWSTKTDFQHKTNNNNSNTNASTDDQKAQN